MSNPITDFGNSTRGQRWDNWTGINLYCEWRLYCEAIV